MVVVAALELKRETESVLGQAAALARALPAAIWLLHVEPPEPDFVGYEPGPEYIRDSVAVDANTHHQTLHRHRDALRASGLDVHSLILQGAAAEKILQETVRLNANYLVIGSEHHSLLRHLFRGSLTDDIVHHAPCPVLVVPISKVEKP